MTEMTGTISRAQVLYPPSDLDDFFSIYDYNPIIQSFGVVLAQGDLGCYQGDTVAVLQDCDKGFGFLAFSYGSCTVCDALQACSTHAEIDELIDELENSIRWFSSLQEVKDYVADDENRKGSCYYHYHEWSDFKRKVQAL